MNYVIPHQFPAEPDATSTNGFTIGYRYEIIDRCNSTVTVKNDNGHDRVIIPGVNSPHIIFTSHGGKLGIGVHRSVGYFSEYNE